MTLLDRIDCGKTKRRHHRAPLTSVAYVSVPTMLHSQVVRRLDARTNLRSAVPSCTHAVSYLALLAECVRRAVSPRQGGVAWYVVFTFGIVFCVYCTVHVNGDA